MPLFARQAAACLRLSQGCGFHAAGVNRHTCGLPHALQLLHGRRARQVGGDEQRRAAAAFQAPRQFGGGRRFSGSLEPGHEEYRRRLRGKTQLHVLTAQQLHHLIPHHLDQLLPGGQRTHDLLAHGLFPDTGQEIPGDTKMNVRLQQRHANFSQAILHVGFAEMALATQLLEDVAQALGKVVKHGLSPAVFGLHGTNP